MQTLEVHCKERNCLLLKLEMLSSNHLKCIYCVYITRYWGSTYSIQIKNSNYWVEDERIQEETC